MQSLLFNSLARLANFLCPGIVQLYQGNVKTFLLLSALPFALIFSLCWSKLVFIGLSLFYLPIAFLSAQLLAAVVTRYNSLKTKNNRTPFFLIASVGWCVIWYGLLYFIALNKSWLLGFDLYRITSNSMEPTLYHGEYVLADTTISKIDRNDIVFFQHQPLGDQVNVKRVFALSGDSVKVQSNKSSPFLLLLHQEGGIKIKEKEAFVTGDNTDASLDSREFGAIPSSSIKAKAMNIYRNGRWEKIVPSVFGPQKTSAS